MTTSLLMGDHISEGISNARYNENSRKILVYFNPLKIDVQAIVNKVSKITEVEKRFILTNPSNNS